MAYTTEIGALKKAPSISWSEEGAKNFMINLTKKAIAVILQEMIPSHLVESILKLITVKFEYEPLKCTTVHVGKSRGPSNHCDSPDEGVCFIYENTVIGVCDDTSANVTKTVKQVPKKYLTLNGSLKMSYYFLGPWNEKQWRAFFDEVQRYLSRSRFGDYFSGMSLIITSIETE
ncbi:hypothetical protein DICVIV_12958 [Dictyocaulus viviparus]|uniref:Uncharacterized protein n=1 Tax=Dictyocaulus viviparus TaxID=29172 RepID=A0A0D8X936_DICVI|nr:hypothetical protein DICVIV_12958 [Dictyocaulus viviparus]